MTCHLCGTEIDPGTKTVMRARRRCHPCCVSLCVDFGYHAMEGAALAAVMERAPTFGQRAYIQGLDIAHPGMGPIAEKILSAEGPEDAAGY